eukprot:TRINITY_DN2032_c0_g1_i1.p3 TRINITY_DN2032_c0_g1~~TRINITY_DN2032_c0_g1_i1.p3  ORF type:complete len:214 (-),score=-7.46 TRINITY_DN2032_c0_g1_i1:156-797(-)
MIYICFFKNRLLLRLPRVNDAKNRRSSSVHAPSQKDEEHSQSVILYQFPPFQVFLRKVQVSLYYYQLKLQILIDQHQSSMTRYQHLNRLIIFVFVLLTATTTPEFQQASQLYYQYQIFHLLQLSIFLFCPHEAANWVNSTHPLFLLPNLHSQVAVVQKTPFLQEPATVSAVYQGQLQSQSHPHSHHYHPHSFFKTQNLTLTRYPRQLSKTIIS